jgi:hypothetical protein
MKDNSISKQIEVSNSIETLSFFWTVCDLNDNLFHQYKNNIEIRFNLEWFKSNTLKYFLLYSKDKKHFFIIDLIKGTISYNNAEEINENQEIKNNIRLICFRRNRVEIGTLDLKEKKHTIIYHIGYQYNSEDGTNHKIVLEISQNGSFVIRS